MEEKQILTRPPAVWVQIDLNARSRDGYTRARMSRATGPLVAGDQNVIVYEPEDRVAAPATVIRVDAERGIVYLDVSWTEMDDDTVYGWMTLPNMAKVSGAERNAASDVSMRLGIVGTLRASGFLPIRDSLSRVLTFPSHSMAAS